MKWLVRPRVFRWRRPRCLPPTEEPFMVQATRSWQGAHDATGGGLTLTGYDGYGAGRVCKGRWIVARSQRSVAAELASHVIGSQAVPRLARVARLPLIENGNLELASPQLVNMGDPYASTYVRNMGNSPSFSLDSSSFLLLFLSSDSRA